MIEFIVALSTVLQVPFHTTTATALTYWHQQATFVSGPDSPPALDAHLVACTCVHLACKQTEVPRKLRDVINAGFWILHRSFLDTEDDIYWDLKESLVAAELILLRILAFDTAVETPHPWIVFLAQELFDESVHSSRSILVNRTYLRVAGTAVAIANDSFLHSRTCLNVSPKATAAACLVLSARLHGQTLKVYELAKLARIDEERIEAALEGLIASVGK